MPLFTSKMRAALLYDRQYFAVGKMTDEEVPEEAIFRIEDADAEYLATVVEQFTSIVRPTTPRPPEAISAHVESRLASIMVGIYKRYGVDVVPLFSKAQQFDEYCLDGTNRLVAAVLDQVQVVDDTGLSWDQVLQFRSDAESVRKLRDLHLWMRETVNVTSVSHAQDLVGQKLADYEEAIRRHGLQTKIGVLKAIIDWRGLMGDAAAASIGAAFGGAVGAALGAGLAIAGQVIAHVAERRLALDEAINGNREIAVLHDLSRLAAEHGNGGP